MVKNIFSLLSSRQSTILTGAAIIMIPLIFSKILGLVKDRLLVHTFPPSEVGIYLAAFRIPDLVFQLLIFGALSVAFIPVFTDELEQRGKEEAFELARSILNLALLLLAIATVVIYIFIGPLTSLVVPGFTPAEQAQVADLTKIILIGQLVLAVGALLSGILQSFQRFIIPALTGIFYNLGIILGIILLAKPYGIYGVAYGVILGAILHVLIQIPMAFSFGFRLTLPKNIFHPGSKEIVRLMSVRTLGLAAEQVNETVGVVLASFISTASLTYLTFATRLELVPVSLFGATIAQAALPILSAEKAKGKLEEFKVTTLTTLHQILFLALPATAILIVMRIPSVRLVFGASQFDWTATVLTGQTLAYMAIGLSCQAISLLLVRAFYALKDTKTPVIISFITVLVNVVLSTYFTLVLHFDVWALGLAFAVSMIVSAVLLFFGLHRKIGGFDLNLAFKPLGKMLIATIVMGVALYIPIKLLDQVIFDTTRTINLLALTGIASAFAISVYILLVWFMRVRELNTYIELIRKVGSFQNLMKSEEMVQKTDSV